MLCTAGYVVETARAALDMVAILAEHPPDVPVLDFVLPIVIMSAVGDEREKVRALDAGADDYVAKPFRGDQLLARSRGVLQPLVAGSGPRRSEPGSWSSISHAAGAVVLITPTEFEIVRVLAQHQGRLVPDGQLTRAAWGPE